MSLYFESEAVRKFYNVGPGSSYEKADGKIPNKYVNFSNVFQILLSLNQYS